MIPGLGLGKKTLNGSGAWYLVIADEPVHAAVITFGMTDTQLPDAKAICRIKMGDKAAMDIIRWTGEGSIGIQPQFVFLTAGMVKMGEEFFQTAFQVALMHVPAVLVSDKGKRTTVSLLPHKVNEV